MIEDTESSVDLVHRSWGLFNYPARLSYSATPADFGSLVVQRRRWANGGLLIVPRLMRIIMRCSERPRAIHALMRFHYLVSISAVNIGLVVLFFVPFADWYANVWLPLTAAPYFGLYTHDLRLAGYRAWDVVRVYALNLMLVPVNLGGVPGRSAGDHGPRYTVSPHAEGVRPHDGPSAVRCAALSTELHAAPRRHLQRDRRARDHRCGVRGQRPTPHLRSRSLHRLAALGGGSRDAIQTGEGSRHDVQIGNVWTGVPRRA